jgi:multidrug efflux pump subunit AcrA (membrane-fusion protein)
MRILKLSLCGLFLVFGALSLVQTAPQDPNVLYYYCPMHTFEHSEKPGKCPLCGMDLIPKRKTPGEAPVAEAPDALKGLAAIDISSLQSKMIDVKLAKAEMMPVIRIIRTLGDFVTPGKTKLSQTRELTAEVYALDAPFVKRGQKVLVSSLNGGNPRAGVVIRTYPYDGTQAKARIHLDQPGPAEIYANVEIEVTTSPRLAVPREAVLSTETQAYVYVRDGEGHFAPRAVEVGFKGDDFYEITSGLKEGEQVAWGGTFMLDADSHIQGTGE